jgi:hypothetical protein
MAQARFKELKKTHAGIRVQKVIIGKEPFLAFAKIAAFSQIRADGQSMRL